MRRERWPKNLANLAQNKGIKHEDHGMHKYKEKYKRVHYSK
jgi:hypothetical protein